MNHALSCARHLAARIHALIASGCGGPVLHAAYKLTSGVLNHALSFDICVLPMAIVCPIAEDLDRVVSNLLSVIVGDGWTDDTHALLHLPRSHGGCGVQTTMDRAHTAFLGTVLRCPPALSAEPVAWQASGVLHACEQSIAWLRTQGVHLDSWGMPRCVAPHPNDVLHAHSLPLQHRVIPHA